MEKSLKSMEIIIDKCDADLHQLRLPMHFLSCLHFMRQITNSSVKGYICNVFVRINMLETIIV